MNIENLKCFNLVAENLSFARAAEALYISQPAVTKQISTLERELGVSLFIRSTRHVELTQAGMSFYKDAKDLVQKSELAVSRVRKHNNHLDTLSIGLSSDILLFYLSPFLKKYHELYPEIQPQIQVYGYKVISNLFREDKLDAMFYYKENMTKMAGIQFLELKKDHLSCVLPSGHPLSAGRIISLADLENDTIIACNPLNAPLSTAAFQQRILQQHPADRVLYCDTIEIAHCMIASGMGISILPDLLTLKSPDFRTVPYEDDTEISFGLFYHRQTANSALDKLLKIMTEL